MNSFKCVAFKYSENKTPEGYSCSKCKVFGVKLWRQYQTFANHVELMCLECACKNQDEIRTPTEDGKSLYTDEVHYLYRTSDMQEGWWQGYDPKKGIPVNSIETKEEKERTDTIGWLVPAIPTEEGDTFWGYTSVPENGCNWWYNLPARKN